MGAETRALGLILWPKLRDGPSGLPLQPTAPPFPFLAPPSPVATRVGGNTALSPTRASRNMRMCSGLCCEGGVVEKRAARAGSREQSVFDSFVHASLLVWPSPTHLLEV